MKKIKRILIAAIAALTITSVAVTAHADAAKAEADLSNAESVTEKIPEGSADEEMEGEAGVTDGESEKSEVGEGFFPALYEACAAHADDIFAALAFIGTLVVGYGYKKGLLPTISKASVGIRDTLERAREQGSEESARLLLGFENLESELKKSDGRQAELCEQMARLSERVHSLSDDTAERERLRLILTSQVDMLYDIFMASAIPQYQKDAAAARIHCMREELGAYDLGEK